MSKDPKTKPEAANDKADALPKRRASDKPDTKPKGKKQGTHKPTGRNRPGESKHSVRRIEAVEKQAEALEYRKMGYSYAQIGEQLEVTPQGAAYMIESALKRTLQEPADVVRQLELGRLDAMFAPVYSQATQGNLMALAGCLNIMSRRAKLIGLDAATKVDTKHSIDPNEKAGVIIVGATMTPEEWDAAAKAQQAALVQESAAGGSE